MISRPNTWTHINLALSIEVKDTNWFLGKNSTDQRARDWSPKVIPRFMTDRIAKKPWNVYDENMLLEVWNTLCRQILGKWHQDFRGLVYQMISAYTVQMYTQHRVYVRKARQASCNLRKKLMDTGACSIHMFALWSDVASFCSQFWGCSKPAPSETGRADTWQVSLIQTEMVNPNVKSCCSISGIWQAHMRPALRFLFSYDVSPASLAQLQSRCAVCHADGIHFPTL